MTDIIERAKKVKESLNYSFVDTRVASTIQDVLADLIFEIENKREKPEGKSLVEPLEKEIKHGVARTVESKPLNWDEVGKSVEEIRAQAVKNIEQRLFKPHAVFTTEDLVFLIGLYNTYSKENAELKKELARMQKIEEEQREEKVEAQAENRNLIRQLLAEKEQYIAKLKEFLAYVEKTTF